MQRAQPHAPRQRELPLRLAAGLERFRDARPLRLLHLLRHAHQRPPLPPPRQSLTARRWPDGYRKSIDGLMALVRTTWGEDVYSGHLFAFVSRRGQQRRERERRKRRLPSGAAAKPEADGAGGGSILYGGRAVPTATTLPPSGAPHAGGRRLSPGREKYYSACRRAGKALVRHPSSMCQVNMVNH
ncbi:IS66 family insertion sequence element accessory protein TnpB [Corallococcus sp. BB11-1]|uniref:IS66 family insertion sequence element accessory protein TnpB n=1 Tax=Corallococcus sp. BB11-1 TaxID=2996783 RepID=UPI003B63722B